MEMEDKLSNAKPAPKPTPAPKPQPVVRREPTMEVKPVEEQDVTSQSHAAVDPMDSPIDELLRERADERRRKLKDFNYKFQNSVSSIDEIEKEPAYKRQGIDLSDARREEGKVSRTTLGEDSNDEIRLRSNNSFLHDNVD